MTATLELPEDPLRGHLPLQVLDGALDALVSNLDFERLTLDGIGGIRQGRPDMADLSALGKPW